MSLAQALEIARQNPVEGLPRMGAVVYLNGFLIGIGMNSRKTDPLAAKYGRHPDAIFMHAELAAIKDALRTTSVGNLKKCTLYIARVLKDGSPALAKPCVGCSRAILEFGLKNVEWTT